MGATPRWMYRFRRARFLRRAPAVAGLAVGLVTAITVILHALSLSGEQQAERDVGRLEWRMDLSQVGSPRFLPRDLPRIGAAVQARPGVQEIDTEWSTFDVRPDTAPTQLTTFQERDWSLDPLPGRYRLVRGRMPARPGEVAVSRLTAPHVRDGRLRVLSGRATFTVVGQIDDRYTEMPQILAGAGTAASFSDAVLREFPTLSGAAAVAWTGGSPDDVAQVVAPLVAPAPAAREDTTRALSGATTSRGEVASRQVRTFGDRFPLVGWVLVLGLPLVAGAAAAGSARRHLSHRARTLGALGAPGPLVRRVLVGALVVATTAWVLIGIAGGLLGALAARWWLAGHGTHQPLSPLTMPWAPLGSATLACLAGLLTVALPRLGAVSRPQPGRRPSPWLTFVRRTAAAAGAAGAVALATSTRTTRGSMILTGVVLGVAVLVVPDIVPAVLRRLPEGRTQQRLALRQLRADPSRAQAAVLVLTLAVTLPVALFTVVASLLGAGQAARVSEVPRGQVVVRDAGGGFAAPRPEVVDAVRANLPDSPVVRLSVAAVPGAPVGVDGARAMGLWAVQSPAEVELIGGRRLSTAQRAVLDGGGILVWDGRPVGPRRLVRWGESTAVATVPAAPAVVDRSWQLSASGIVTQAGLRRHGLTREGGMVVFTGVSDIAAATVARDVVARGYDTGQVAVYRRPDDQIVPLAFTVASLLLALVVVLSSAVLFRGQARAVASYLGGLVAVGVPPSWAGRVLVRQAAVLCALGVTLGLFIGVAGVATFAAGHPAVKLVVPWLPVGAAVGSAVVAALAVSVLSGRRLRAVDRWVD